EADRQAANQVVAIALEERVRLHGDHAVQVATAAPAGARLALSADADALPVVNPGRNLDRDLDPATGPAASAAIDARGRDGRAAPPAGGAVDHRAGHEEAHRGLLLDLPVSAAGFARGDRRPRLAAAAFAALADVGS